ncbi:MAG: hypothetical protein FJX52_06455 [Alphaproteobacteria bacterium]|nr:hypothetical protein [Alphaproteobacteria bacterium]
MEEHSRPASHILIDHAALKLQRVRDSLWEADNFSVFVNFTMLEDRRDGVSLEIYYRVAHPGFFNANPVSVTEHVTMFSIHKDKNPQFTEVPPAANQYGRVVGVVAEIDGRKCLLFRQYWGAVRDGRGGGAGPRSTRNVIGNYCQKAAQSTGPDVFNKIVSSYELRP